ncbi:hypothetical protein JXM67_13210 [candidate division WOR-3 bacterium]|nr:hypothetical protein [candidate division WOR-3 bacterium]
MDPGRKNSGYVGPVPESEVNDLTAGINDQVEIMKKWNRVFEFTFLDKARNPIRIIRTPGLVSEIKKLEKDHGKLADLQSRVKFIDLNERILDDGRRE